MKTTRLNSLLQKASHLRLISEASRGLLLTLVLLVAAFLAAVLVDTLLALPSWALALADAAMVSLLGVALWKVGARVRNNLFDPRRSARRVESILAIPDNRLINALDLHETPSTAASVELRSDAVAKGENLAMSIGAQETVNWAPLGKAAVWAAAAAMIVLVGWVAAPSVFGRAAIRYFDPFGDHPAFTLVKFDVAIEPEVVYYGRPASINVTMSGPDLPDQANVVFVEGETRQPAPMLAADEASFMLYVDRAERTRQFYIDTPKGRSDIHTLEVEMTPLFESSQASYKYPSYTNWPSGSHALDTRGIQAIEGTEVTVSVESNMPLREGKLELSLGKEENATVEEVVLHVDPGNAAAASGRFTLTQSGRYRISLTGSTGQPSGEYLEGRVTASPDQPPRVDIVNPDPQLAVVEGWKVPVVVQAADDVAVKKLLLFKSLNDESAKPTELDVQTAQPTLAEGQHEFDLEAMGAKPGDVISYYASAYDNRPPKGQFSDTEIHRIQVISQEEYLDLARQSYRMEEILAEHESFQQQLDKLGADREKALEELKRLQEKMDAGQALTDEEKEQMQKLEEMLKEFAEQAQDLAEQMNKRTEQEELYDFEKSYNEQLRKLAEQLQQQSEMANELQENMSPMKESPPSSRQREAFQQSAAKFAENNQPFDEQTQSEMSASQQDMQTLKEMDDLMAAADRVQSVIREQRELADRMREFQDRENLNDEQQQRADQMAKEQELLRQELEEAARELRQCAGECKSDFPKTSGDAEKVCDAIEEMKIPSDQGQAARQARDGAGERAHAKAEEAAEKLESLQSDCPSSQGAGQEPPNKDPGLGFPKDQIGKSLQQLAQGRQLPSLKKGQKGQQGSGFQGADTRMTVVGPHLPQGTKTRQQAGRYQQRDQDGRADGAIVGARLPALGAESLTPEERERYSEGGAVMRGVPVGYREQAEAYFRRLAEEK